MHGIMVRIFLLLFSHLVLSNSLQPMDWSMPGLPVLHHLLELAQTHVHWVGDAIPSSHPLSSPSPAFSLSQHQSLFQWVNSLHQVVKVLELQLQHQSFQWIFRTDILYDCLVWSCSPRDSEESSPTSQFKSINSFVLSLFIVQLSHPYMTTEKSIALTIRTFVGKVMSLLFNMLSRLNIVFLSRSKHLLISWLQSPSDFWPQEKNVCHCLHCFPIYLPWSDDSECHYLTFLNV